MGEMDWRGVIMAALAASAVLALTFRIKRAGWLIAAAPLSFVSALMLGHALARIGPEKLAAKPQLYFMQSGGLALAFVIPALWLIQLRDSAPRRQTILDSLAFLTAYLVMGAVLWLRG